MCIKLLAFLFISLPVFGKIQVVATLPELAWAAKALGGDDVEVISLLSGKEDPHYVDASPAFVFKVAKADLVVFNGMQLESGWLPKVLQMSGNSKVQPGEKGLCNASMKVEKLEVATNYDRSKGDIHPMGNPHYTLSPKRMIQAGAQIRECLEKAGKKNYKKSFGQYKEKLQKLYKQQKERLKKLQDKKFMVYHREFSYFLRDFELNSVGSLEEVPGVLPSAAFLSKTAAKAKKEKVFLALASSVSPKKYMEKFKELSGVDFVMLDIHAGRGDDYASFFNQVVDEIVKNAK